MNALVPALAALLPSIGVGVLFWFAIRALVNADRTERQALAKMDADERAAELAAGKEDSASSV
jgi:threonine/homoserine/homoserine lactone efflux protein